MICRLKCLCIVILSKYPLFIRTLYTFHENNDALGESIGIEQRTQLFIINI